MAKQGLDKALVKGADIGINCGSQAGVKTLGMSTP